jgi:hypothetical protein
MKQTQSPFRIERRLTPELFDHYVARARAERAKAIAEFGRQLATAVSRIAQRLVRRRLPRQQNPAEPARLLTR